MSEEITIQCEIRSMLIMKDTLKQMGVDYRELDDHRIEMKRSYHNMVIDSQTGIISCDSSQRSEVNNIKKEYMVNFFKDKAVKEGNKFKETRKANGEVEIHIIRN